MDTLIYKPLKNLSVSWNSRYIGRQYIDNTSNRERSLNDYFVNGLAASYAVHPRWMKEIGFALTINNIFSSKYESNAWVYPYLQGGTYYESNGYFPQALINCLLGIVLKISDQRHDQSRLVSAGYFRILLYLCKAGRVIISFFFAGQYGENG